MAQVAAVLTGGRPRKVGKTSLAMNRLRHRIISGLLLPSSMRRAE